jgi:hypothetical protein
MKTWRRGDDGTVLMCVAAGSQDTGAAGELRGNGGQGSGGAEGGKAVR